MWWPLRMSTIPNYWRGLWNRWWSSVLFRAGIGLNIYVWDKGYDNPTGRETALRHRYEPHIRRIGEEKTGQVWPETLSRAAVGGGENVGLALKVSWNPGEI